MCCFNSETDLHCLQYWWQVSTPRLLYSTGGPILWLREWIVGPALLKQTLPQSRQTSSSGIPISSKDIWELCFGTCRLSFSLSFRFLSNYSIPLLTSVLQSTLSCAFCSQSSVLILHFFTAVLMQSLYLSLGLCRGFYLHIVHHITTALGGVCHPSWWHGHSILSGVGR